MIGSSLLGWVTLGGLLVLLISEAVLALFPYVEQAVEGGIVEAVRRAGVGVAREPVEEVPGQSEDDAEGRHRP